MAPIRGDEGQADSRREEHVRALVEKFRRKHTPNEQVVAQGRHQKDVRRGRERAEQCVAEAGVSQG